MEAAVKAELDKLTGLIVNTIPVEQIFLFGSYAYGTPHRDSDLDLYVVLRDDCPLRDLDAGLQIRMAIARKKSMPVDILARRKTKTNQHIRRLAGSCRSGYVGGRIPSCTVITHFAVQPRYDRGLDISEADMRLVIQHARTIKDFLTAEIPELFEEIAPSTER